MSFRTLTFIFLILSPAVFAQGRGPAVEDFVGIEVDHPEGTPQGTEGLFNFEKDMDKFEKNKQKPFKPATNQANTTVSEPTSITAIVSIALVLGLPIMMWLLMMNRLRHKAQMENVSNIEVLEKYRKQREEAKKHQDDIKKAS